MGFAHTALAQAPGQVDPPSPAFLEKRVPDELAAEGVVLSRNNLALQVEQVGGRWLVSLADLNTGRVVASTKLDTLPVDREAAVASMTHVVADLVAQVVGRSEPPPPAIVAPPESVRPPPAVDNRAERDLAELRFKRQSIRFGANYRLLATGTAVALMRRWVAYMGELDQELAPEAFYVVVGRADLAARYRSRRHAMIGSFVAGAVSTTAGLVVLGVASRENCEFGSPNYSMCIEDHERHVHNAFAWGAGIVGVGIVTLYVGFHLYRHPHPIDENEAKTLADGYNQNLRRRLGLPTVARHLPRLHDVRWTPHVTGHQAGLALSARF
jgi:hypothetical protein